MGTNRVVVIADDEPAVCSALARLLAHEDYECHAAADGQGALDLCRQHRPAVLFVDRAMPPPFYFQISQTLKAELGEAAPRIVLITGGDTDGIWYAETVDAVMAKPFDADTLLAMLGRLGV